MREFTASEAARVSAATTFEELYEVAIRIIESLPQPLGQVIGPISTGGLGSRKANLALFERVVNCLIRRGYFVFNQMPFEEKIRLISETPYFQGEDQLLEVFYRPIFMSGKIDHIWIMPAWRTSYGATWEHGLTEDCGIKHRELSHTFMRELPLLRR